MRAGSCWGLLFVFTMTELISISAKQTMSSLQIAELTGKRHDAVLRDVRKLLSQGVQAHNFVESFVIRELPNGGSKQEPMFLFTKTGCLILASGYNALLREKIISRWIELETAAQPKAPTTLKEALMLALAQQEQIEQQQKEIAMLSVKIDTMQPKAEYYDSILASPDSLVVTQIAKDYGMSPQEFNKRLCALGIQYKVNGQWVLYAKYQGEGYTDSQTGRKRNGSGSWMLTVWTQKGRLFLYTMLKEANVLPVIERYSGYQLPPVGKPKNIETDPTDFYR